MNAKELITARDNLLKHPDSYFGMCTAKEVAEALDIAIAAEKLVRCKGRFHSEQNYRALAALFGVEVPELPPLAGEKAPEVNS